MAEENAHVSGDDGNQPEKTFTQAELEAKIQDRLQREGVKKAELDKMQAELETLRAEKQQRDESELTELEKWKKRAEEIEAEKAKVLGERDEAILFRESVESREKSKVEKSLDGLSDSQKDIVEKLPLFDRMAAINEFKGSKKQPGDWGKGESGSNLSRADALKSIQDKRDKGDLSWKEDYEKFQKMY